MTIHLREITDDNRPAVLEVRVHDDQVKFVGTVEWALLDAVDEPEGHPWYRALYDGDEPVGFVMISWDVPPNPPEIIGPWYLWKLIIDHRRQGQGYGRAAVRLIADLVRSEGGTTLFTSYVEGDGGPAGFYERLGFVPTGARNIDNEVIVALDLV